MQNQTSVTRAKRELNMKKALSQEAESPATERNLLCKGDTCCSSCFEPLARCRFISHPRCSFVVDFVFSVVFKQRCSVAICPLLVQTNRAFVCLTFHVALPPCSPLPATTLKGQSMQTRSGKRCSNKLGLSAAKTCFA